MLSVNTVLTRPVFVADQGESNAGAPERYARCFPEMISDWRHRWAGDADIPFIFAQIAPVRILKIWCQTLQPFESLALDGCETS